MNTKVTDMEPLSEVDTRAKFIDPMLYKIGWTEDLVHREETARGIDIIGDIHTGIEKQFEIVNVPLQAILRRAFRGEL